MENGKIFFVGTGDGYVIFLTVKGRRVISKADVVIYDSDVGDEIVTLIPDSSEKVFIDGYENTDSDEIYGIMAENARQGKSVVCLRSGAPFIFDNADGYAKAFADEGISVEIIPEAFTCGDGSGFACDEGMPLSGFNIFLTRPKEMSNGLVAKLRMLGARVLEIPAVKLMLMQNDIITDVMLNHIWDYQWIIFTSRVGVDAFFRQAKKRQKDARKFSACKFGVIGAETKKRLEYYGITADLMPENYNIRELGNVLAKKMRLGERALLVREQDADKELIRRIGKVTSVLIEHMSLYKTVLRKSADLPEGIQFKYYFESGKTIVIFSSASEVKGFLGMFSGYDFGGIKAVCVGKKTLKAAASSEMQTTFVENEPSEDLLVELVQDIACDG